MDVKCSLHDYNEYRKYLRQVHADRVKRELKKVDRLFVERTALRFAEDQARKEAKKYKFAIMLLQYCIIILIFYKFRLKEREKLVSERQPHVQQQLQEELKIQKLKEQSYRTMRRLKLLQLVKREERRLMNIKHEERIEHIRQKCKIAAEITRRKIIDTLMDWKKKDKVRKKAKEKLMLDTEQQKQKEVEERYVYCSIYLEKKSHNIFDVQVVILIQ